MANSNAKKKRLKIEREGKMSPDAKRSPFSDINVYRMMSVKKTKTKQEILRKEKHKEHYHY